MGLINRIRASGPPPVQPDAEPLSVSGRGHVDGFLQLEELNVALQGRQGLEVFDRMFRTDGDVSQVVRLVVNPIVAGTWEVAPLGGSDADQQALDDAEFIRWVLFENMSPNLRGHFTECLPVLFRSGFAPFEKVWEVTDYQGKKVTVPRSLQLRLPRTIYRWKQDKWGGLEAIEQYLPVPKAQVIAGPNVARPGDPVLQGPDYMQTVVDDAAIQDPTIITDTRQPDYRQTVWMPMASLLYYRIGAEGDNWEGMSMLRPAYKHWLFKDSIERMDAIAQEKEALGLPVCYPPMGATPQQLDAMETILGNLRTNSQGYVLMPGPKASTTGTGTPQVYGNGWLLEYLKMGSEGSGRNPQPSLQYHTNKIAAAFIAEFLRTGTALTGGGAGREAPFEQDPFLLAVEGIVGLLEEIINDQLVAPIMAYNRPNSKGAPKVRMSLVDATTISELADFILKLVQVGALLPDQNLEDFLRARADLPPSDPELVQERGGLDDSLRREVMMGKNGSPAGTNGPAGSETGGSATGTKGVDNKDKAGASANGNGGPPSKPPAPTSAHDIMTQRAVAKDKATGGKRLAADNPDQPPYMPGSQRIRWRPQAYYELAVDLDGIEDHFDAAPQRFLDSGSLQTHNHARKVTESYPTRLTEHPELCQTLSQCLQDSYNYGAQTVSDEIAKKGENMAYALDAAWQPRASMDERAQHATTEVLDAMHHAHAHAKLSGLSMADRQRAAEKAGVIALKKAGRTHALAAFNQGRNERMLDALGDDKKWGFVYTAILDANTCDHCAEMDDGKVRSIDDPVLVDNMPPNPHCDSAQGAHGNQCRCFLTPEPMPSE